MLKQLIQLRHQLHQFPDLSGNEDETARRIKDFITFNANASSIIEFADAGFGVVFDNDQAGPTILFRCELDALPIQEENTFQHRSTRPGISHKCGHDGHMTILCGLALKLSNHPLPPGKIVLLFQPAEENGRGAKSIVSDESFISLKPDYIFALHNIPGRPLHEVIIKESICAPSVISLAIEMQGRVAHASSPETGINPAMTISSIIHQFDAWNHPDPRSQQFALLTPIYANLGQKAYGIAAGKGSLHYTIRTWTTSHMEQLKNSISSFIDHACAAHKLNYQLDWFDEFPTVQNNQECNELIEESAKTLQLNYSIEETPFKFGEDFGWFSHDYKTALMGLGAGLNCSPLHNESYDFPDELIATGVELFYKIAKVTS